MPIKVRFDDRGLRNLQRRVRGMSGEHKVPISELLTDDFVRCHTDFETLDKLFEASGFKIGIPEDFAAIPDDEWDAYIASRTQFESWQEMLSAATVEYTKRESGF